MPYSEGEGLETMGSLCQRAMPECAIYRVRVRCCKPWGRHVRGLCQNVP